MEDVSLFSYFVHLWLAYVIFNFDNLLMSFSLYTADMTEHTSKLKVDVFNIIVEVL